MHLTDAFNTFIEDIKRIKGVELYKPLPDRFHTFIDEVKSLMYSGAVTKMGRGPEFDELLVNFKQLKSQTYESRLQEAQEGVSRRSELFRMSSFELMEHDFRENTHSNILKYLFDHKYNGQAAVNALYHLITLKGGELPDLKDKLNKQKYQIIREHYLGDGRVDLLIKDPGNKLLIVIENKVLAGISSRELEDERTNTITQLERYRNFFDTHPAFGFWDKFYLLISYRDPGEMHLSGFIYLNFETLYHVIRDAEFNSLIAEDYLLLLYRLNHKIENKDWLMLQADRIRHQAGSLNLNTLELINNFTHAK